jgi:negative regulator of replication initiation
VNEAIAKKVADKKAAEAAAKAEAEAAKAAEEAAEAQTEEAAATRHLLRQTSFDEKSRGTPVRLAVPLFLFNPFFLHYGLKERWLATLSDDKPYFKDNAKTLTDKSR